MTVRVSWPKIKSIVGVDASTPFIFIIPHGGRHLLQAITDRLDWEATYRTDDYDFSDWDDLQALVADTQRGLMGDTKLSDLIDTLLLLRDELRALKINMQTTVQCCDAISPVTSDPGVVLDDGAVPEVYGNEVVTTWDEYKAFVCGAAHAWVDGMVAILQRLSDAIDNNLLVVGGIALLLTVAAIAGILVPIEFGVAVGLFTVLVSLLTGEPLDEIVLWMQQNKATIANVIFCAGDATTATDDLKDYLEANLSELQWSIMRWFDYSSAMAVIYGGVNGDGDVVNVQPLETCSCAGGTQLYGFEKLEGVDNPVRIPSEGTYTGLGWLGGAAYWECVQGGQLSFSGWPIGTTMSVDWSITLHSTTLGSHNLELIIGTTFGTRVQLVQADAVAGNTYSGTLVLQENDTHFAAIANSVGLKLSSWSVYGLGEV